MNVFELFKESYGVGVVASKKQAKDPRYSHSLTKDVRPDTPKKNAKALMLASKNLNEAPAGQAVPDENLVNILKLIAGLESNGRNIQNQTGSGAHGIYQFVPETFELVKAGLDDSHPYKNVSWDDFKDDTDIQNSYASAGMMDNVRYLNNKKIPVNVETIYNAHHFGPFVASLMHKNPDRTLKDIYEQNKDIKGMPSWDKIKEQNPYLNDDATGASTTAYHKKRASNPAMQKFYDEAGVDVAGLYDQDEISLPNEAPVVATTPQKEVNYDAFGNVIDKPDNEKEPGVLDKLGSWIGGIKNKVGDFFTKPDEGDLAARDDAINAELGGTANVQDLAKANDIKDANKITVGQKIKMPDGSEITVKPGDTMSKITANYNKGKQPKASDVAKAKSREELEAEYQAQAEAGADTATLSALAKQIDAKRAPRPKPEDEKTDAEKNDFEVNRQNAIDAELGGTDAVSAKKELEIEPVSITVNDTRSKIDKLRDDSKDMSLSDEERTKAQEELRRERDALQSKMDELRKDPNKNQMELNRLAGVYNSNFGDTQVDATPIGSSAEEGFRKGSEVRSDDIISPAKLDLLGADIKQQAQAAKERGEEELAKQIDAKAEQVLDQAEKARMAGIQYIDTGGEEPAPIEQQVEKAIEKVIQAEPDVQGASGYRVDPNSERAELDRKTAEADREKRKGSTSYSSNIDSQGGDAEQGSGYSQGGVQKKQAQGYSSATTSQGGAVKQGSGYGQGDVTVSTTPKEDPYPNPGYEGEELRIYNQLSDSQKAKVIGDFEKSKKYAANARKNITPRSGPTSIPDPKPRSLLDIKHQQQLSGIEGGTQLVDPAKAKEVSKILGMSARTPEDKKKRDAALDAIRFKAPSMDQIQQGMTPVVDKSINKDAEPEVDTTPVKATVPPAEVSDAQSAIGRAVQPQKDLQAIARNTAAPMVKPGTNLGKNNASQQAQDAQAQKAEQDAKLAQQRAEQAQQRAEQEQKAAEQKAEQERRAAEQKAKQEQQKAEREAQRQKSLSQGGTSGRNFNTSPFKSAIGQAVTRK